MSLSYRTLIGIAFMSWLIIVIGPFVGILQSADWRPLGKDIKDCQWFYDASSIRHLPGNNTMVWLKRIINDEERRLTIQERTKNNQPLNGYDRWAYEMGLMELHCYDQTIRQLSVIDYDQNGELLENRKIGGNLSIISVDSIADIAYRILCITNNSDSWRMDSPFAPLQ